MRSDADRPLGGLLFGGTWPGGASQLCPDRERIERWLVRAIACLASGPVSRLSIEDTTPGRPLTAVPFALLVVGAIAASRGLSREWATPRL